MSVDLRTAYMGLQLPHPVVASACPMMGDLDMLRRLEDAGIAAAVLPSLFEEQIENEEMEYNRFLELHAESFPEATTYFPEMENYNNGLDGYLKHIGSAKSALSIPIIGSLNGSTPGGWTRYATRIEEAGADALELNVYLIAGNTNQTSEDIEQRYLDLVHSVKSVISIPLSVKIGPYFSSLPNFASKLTKAGADGLVIFNRYLHPDINLDSLEFTTELTLTTSNDIRLPLRWIGILRGELPHLSLAATSGTNAPEDIIKQLLVGADITMIAGVLYKHGPEVVSQLIEGVRNWLEEHDYESVTQLKSSMSASQDAFRADYERSNYMKSLVHFTNTQK